MPKLKSVNQYQSTIVGPLAASSARSCQALNGYHPMSSGSPTGSHIGVQLAMLMHRPEPDAQGADPEVDDGASVAETAATDLDTLHSALLATDSQCLQQTFEYYASYGDFLNVTSLSNANFNKFAYAAKFFLKRSDSSKVDLIFMKSVRTVKGTSEPRMDFDRFARGVAHLVRAQYPASSSTDATFCASIFDKHIRQAKRLEPLPPTPELTENEVIEEFRKAQRDLERVSLSNVCWHGGSRHTDFRVLCGPSREGEPSFFGPHKVFSRFPHLSNAVQSSIAVPYLSHHCSWPTAAAVPWIFGGNRPNRSSRLRKARAGQRASYPRISCGGTHAAFVGCTPAGRDQA